MQYIIAPTGEYLEHSAKGTTWKKHKYIKKIGSRYVYPAKKAVGVKASQAKQAVTSGASKVAKSAKKVAKSGSEALSSAIDKVKDINIFDSFKKNEQKKEQKEENTQLSTENTWGEHILTENIETENILTENIETENVLTENIETEKKEKEGISKAIKEIEKVIKEKGTTIFIGDDGKENFRVKYSAPTGNEKNNAKDLKKKTTKKSTTFFDDDGKERFKVKYHR